MASCSKDEEEVRVFGICLLKMVQCGRRDVRKKKKKKNMWLGECG